MSTVPCPKCGTPSGGVCPRCFLKDYPIQIKNENFDECDCGLAYYRGRWYRDRAELISDLVKKSLTPPQDIRMKVQDVNFNFEAGQLNINAKIEAKYHENTIDTEVSWAIRPKKAKCETCRKQGSGYFEATLQFRDENLNPKLDPDQVADIQRVRGGIDFKMISGEYAQLIANQYGDKGYQIVKSSTLFSQRSGKEIFRFSFSIKPPEFSVGDIILYSGNPRVVLELGRNTKVRDINSSKESNLPSARIGADDVIARSSELSDAQVTSSYPGGIQIMDMESYQTIELKWPKEIKPGTQVKYFNWKGKPYLVSETEKT